MVRFQPTVPSNILSLQRQIIEGARARLGPVSVGPGEGSITFSDSSGTTFSAQPDGARVRFRNGVTPLTPHLESNATQQERQDADITAARGVADAASAGVQALSVRVTNAEAKNVSQDSAINAARSVADGAEAGVQNLSPRMSAVEGVAAGARDVADAAAAGVQTLSGRMTSAEGKNVSQDSAINAARSVADAASSGVQSLSTRMTNAESKNSSQDSAI